MISLAGRDIRHSLGKFIFTGLGLGLLLGVTLTMAGVYRGMVDDAAVLLDNSGADLWVVQQDTLGPYAEASSIYDDVQRRIERLPGVARAANVTYSTMQLKTEVKARELRAMVVGVSQSGGAQGGGALYGQPGQPRFLLAGRHLGSAAYEAVADISSGLTLGEKVRIRRHVFTVVGLTRRMVSASGDAMVFIALKEAQQAQFQKDNAAIHNERARSAQALGLESGISKAGATGEFSDKGLSRAGYVNAVLVQLAPNADADSVAEPIRRWLQLTVYGKDQMYTILVAKLIATSAKQIALFLVILSVVSAAIVAFIIYTLTMAKIREIAVLKLLGTRKRTIAGMIMQQAVALGLIGFVVGKVAATLWAPVFPKYVLLLPGDAARALILVVVVCILASTLAIAAALKVDPAEAIGG